VVAHHVGGQHHPVKPELVERVHQLGERLIGTVARQAGEGCEPARVLRDQLPRPDGRRALTTEQGRTAKDRRAHVGH
jgi:hypothetical protein